MTESLKIYWVAFSTAIQAKFEYRVDFFVGIVTSCMLQISAFLLLSVIFNQTPDLGGWTKDQVILLFGMTAGALGISELFFNHIWWVPNYIVMGDLDRLLTYPVNSLYFLLITKPELHSFGNLITGLILAYWSLVQLHAPWYTFVFVPIFMISGGLLYTAALVVMSALSFRFVAPTSNHLMIANNLLNATRYPISIYPQLIQFVLLVLVPFGSFHYLPAGMLFGKASYAWLPLAAPFLSLLFFFEAGLIWRWGINQYESTGS